VRRRWPTTTGFQSITFGTLDAAANAQVTLMAGAVTSGQVVTAAGRHDNAVLHGAASDTQSGYDGEADGDGQPRLLADLRGRRQGGWLLNRRQEAQPDDHRQRNMAVRLARCCSPGVGPGAGRRDAEGRIMILGDA